MERLTAVIDHAPLYEDQPQVTPPTRNPAAWVGRFIAGRWVKVEKRNVMVVTRNPEQAVMAGTPLFATPDRRAIEGLVRAVWREATHAAAAACHSGIQASFTGPASAPPSDLLQRITDAVASVGDITDQHLAEFAKSFEDGVGQ